MSTDPVQWIADDHEPDAVDLFGVDPDDLPEP